MSGSMSTAAVCAFPGCNKRPGKRVASCEYRTLLCYDHRREISAINELGPRDSLTEAQFNAFVGLPSVNDNTSNDSVTESAASTHVQEAPIADGVQAPEAPTSIGFSSDDDTKRIGEMIATQTDSLTTDGENGSSDTDSSEQDAHTSSSASGSDTDLSENVLHEEEEEIVSEPVSDDVSDSTEEESGSSDTDNSVMENNGNEMNASNETTVAAVEESTVVSSPTNDVSSKAEEIVSESASSDTSVSHNDGGSKIDAPSTATVNEPTEVPVTDKRHALTNISSNQTDRVNTVREIGSFSCSNEELNDVFDALDALGDAPAATDNVSESASSDTSVSHNGDNTTSSSTSTATPVVPVKQNTPAASVKQSTFNKETSIKFANNKGWLTEIYSPIARSLKHDTTDKEHRVKQRYAFVNKILCKHKAFHTIISGIEQQNNYYGFLFPFDCYANKQLDMKDYDAFKRDHRDLCKVDGDKVYTPSFTGCGFNLFKTGLALFDFDFKTYTYTYKDDLLVGSPVELKAIEDTAITDAFFTKLFGAVDCSKVLDVITKSNGHHLYCRWDGSLITMVTNTKDKGCKMRLGTSANDKPKDGEYREYWCELDIKVPINTDAGNGICPLPGTVCLNKLGKEATYRLNPLSTESNIDNLWSFKELNNKIASVYEELDYIAWDRNRFNELPAAAKAEAIKRDPEASEQDKMDAEALAWLTNPCEDGDEDVLKISNTINGSALIDDTNEIIFTDALISAIVKGFEGIRVHGHHSVKANSDSHIKAEPSHYALRTAIHNLTLDETVRAKLLDGIYNTAALTDNAKSGWGSTISFNDKDWTTDVQRNALIAITSWIRSNNEVYYTTELANKLYRPGKDYFDDPTSMFTWQEFQERLDGGNYTSVSTLMHDMAKVLAINTCSAGGRGYFVKRWFREPKLGEHARHNDFVYESHNGPYVSSMLDTIINVPTSSAERERQRMAKRKITEFKEVHVASLLKKDTYRRYLATFRGSVLWSDDENKLSVYKPPAGKYNKAIVEYFIERMKDRVVSPKAWEEEFASHAYRIQRDGNVFIPKYFIHVDPNGHAGKSFNAAAFAQVYGERFANAGATVANLVDTYNAWMFKLLYINFEEVQYSNGRGFDIRDKLKQLTTKNGSVRDMYKVTETAEHKAIISINTNQKDLYGLVNSDPADLRRLVIIEFKKADADVISQWESVVDKTIHDPDFGYSLFHYMCYDYKIPEWFKPTDHCTADIRDEYIKRAKGENENPISRWLGWLMAKPIPDADEDTIYNHDALLLNAIPESYQNWHDDWFLRTKLSKGVGDVAVQSKSVLWNSFKKFCGGATMYSQTHLFKDMTTVYGFTECRVRIYGPKTNPVHSLYISIDKLYELRSKYGGVSQYNEDDDAFDIETEPTAESA